MKKIFLITFLIFGLFSCNRKEFDRSKYILIADHEAPIGYAQLLILKDSTFEFIQGGIGTRRIFKGKAIIKKDSIIFDYYDSIPVVGKKATFTEKHLKYVGFGEIEINKNELKVNK